MEFVSDPATQSKLADLARVAHAGLTVRAAEARQVAIAALEEVAKTAEDPIEKRRAASALFRATASPLVPLAAHAAGTTPNSTAPAPPRRAAPVVRSLRQLRPADVALYAMHSLQAGATPEPQSDIATLAELSEASITIDSREIPTTDLDALGAAVKQTCLRHVRATTDLRPWVETTFTQPSEDEYITRYSCSTGSGHIRIDLRLRRSPRDDRSHHWLIHSITHSSGP